MPGRLTMRGRAVQIVGFCVGAALLVWALSLAGSGQNQEALAKLRGLPASTLASLVALTLASLAINGLMFWVTALPLRTAEVRLPLGETLATNCIATFLSLLPFKLGLLVRSLIHVRKHGMSVGVLLGWFAAFGVLTACTALLAGAVAIARGKVDSVWLVSVLAGLVVLALLAKVLAPVVFARAKQLEGFAAGKGAGTSAVAISLARLAMPAASIFAKPGVCLAHAGLRLLDFATFAARFALLASALGVALSNEHAMLLGSSFLLLNASAPAGTLGFADMGVAGAGTLVGLPTQQIVLLSLVTTALQTAVAGAISAVAWWWVRPKAR